MALPRMPLSRVMPVTWRGAIACWAIPSAHRGRQVVTGASEFLTGCQEVTESVTSGLVTSSAGHR
jgi:hypothetical protein